MKVIHSYNACNNAQNLNKTSKYNYDHIMRQINMPRKINHFHFTQYLDKLLNLPGLNVQIMLGSTNSKKMCSFFIIFR